jgi:hypothetical protein
LRTALTRYLHMKSTRVDFVITPSGRVSNSVTHCRRSTPRAATDAHASGPPKDGFSALQSWVSLACSHAGSLGQYVRDCPHSDDCSSHGASLVRADFRRHDSGGAAQHIDPFGHRKGRYPRCVTPQRWAAGNADCSERNGPSGSPNRAHCRSQSRRYV